MRFVDQAQHAGDASPRAAAFRPPRLNRCCTSASRPIRLRTRGAARRGGSRASRNSKIFAKAVRFSARAPGGTARQWGLQPSPRHVPPCYRPSEPSIRQDGAPQGGSAGSPAPHALTAATGTLGAAHAALPPHAPGMTPLRRCSVPPIHTPLPMRLRWGGVATAGGLQALPAACNASKAGGRARAPARRRSRPRRSRWPRRPKRR